MRLSNGIVIDESELDEQFIRSSGPGGQNVNKVATAVELRFDIARSRSLDDSVRELLLARRDRRMTQDGVLVIQARRFRTQDRNRQDARDRLAAVIEQALLPVTPRVATKPTRASKTRRLDAKRQRGVIKSRRSVRDWD